MWSVPLGTSPISNPRSWRTYHQEELDDLVSATGISFLGPLVRRCSDTK